MDWLERQAVMLVVQCWNDLGPERQIGFGVMGCIPKRAVRDWAHDEGLDEEVARTLWFVIRKLDADRVDRELAKKRLEGA